MNYRLRRALLFMPGDDRQKIEKGAGLDLDAVIMDLEDGVALNHKEQARETTRYALQEVDFGTTETMVRINPVNDEVPLWKADLDETIEGNPDAYVIPKVEKASQVRRVADYLTRAERKYGWIAGSIQILAIIETAKGVANLKKIARKSDRLSALVFGAEDLAGDIGATRTPDGWEVFYARSAVVLHAKANNLQAIDTPFVDLTAEDSHLIADVEQARYMGYTGKLAIHPKHMPHIQQTFTPTDEQILNAKRLIEAHEAHQDAGTGVFAFEGRMVDMPMVRAAQSVLSQAQAAGVDLDALPT